VVTSTTPDGSITAPGYNLTGLLETVRVRLPGAAEPTTFVADIDYNPKGQRERIAYGNGVATTYTYDAATYRLALLETKRGGEVLQGLRYTYDPVGNVAQIYDNAFPIIFNCNQKVRPVKPVCVRSALPAGRCARPQAPRYDRLPLP
jgi:hypothetical protein